MSGRWIPPANVPVGPNEQIGRRLFGEPQLVGADDQIRPPGLLDLRHFQERRGTGDISLDRLGRTGFDKRIRDYLIPKADHAGTTFRALLSFDGWVTLTAHVLENPPRGKVKFPIVVSPERPNEPEHIEHNPYHAHVCRPVGHDGHSTALHLKYLFEKGKVEPCRKRPTRLAAIYASVSRLARWASHAWKNR